MTAYAALTDRLYQAVRTVSGASVIVDSSKHASYALLMRDLPNFEFRLIHLVRRSHGVAHSWSKRVLKPGVGDGSSFMSVHPPYRTVGLWIADNLLYDVVARQLPWTTRIRYEDMIADPRMALRRILAELGLPAADQPFSFLDAASAEFPVSHAFSGNPMRLQQGPLVLRIDDEWRTAMSRPRRAMISAATWPLLKHYGYSARVWSASAAMSGPRLQITWPLVCLFVAFPVWWLLGRKRLYLAGHRHSDGGRPCLAGTDLGTDRVCSLARIPQLGAAVGPATHHRDHDPDVRLPIAPVLRGRRPVLVRLQHATVQATGCQGAAHPHDLLDGGGRGRLRRYPGAQPYVHPPLDYLLPHGLRDNRSSRNSCSPYSRRFRHFWAFRFRGLPRLSPIRTTGAETSRR